jgi:energy-coupling factor transporter ATP-binding protein EcfA2
VLEVRYEPQDVSWGELLDKLAQLNYRGEIIGAQGSGKTTLLEDLAEALRSNGKKVTLLKVSREDHSAGLASVCSFIRGVGLDTVLMLDGAEQLSPIAWRCLKWSLSRISGLVITAHTPGRLPLLIHCDTSARLLSDILKRLVPDENLSRMFSAEDLYKRHAGNLRDALRECYDVCSTLSASDAA